MRGWFGCFLLHKWGKWKEIDRGPLLSADGKNSQLGWWLRQSRVCEVCNYLQFKSKNYR